VKVSDYIVTELLRLGVKRVYTVPGGFSMHLNDSVHYSDLQPVYCLHESGAAFAACGEASYTSQLSVCVVTSGPGVTNALTGCASAYQDSLPVLFISGDAKTQNIEAKQKFQLRQAGPQDVDVYHIVKPITKAVWIIRDVPMIYYELRQLVELALTPRRGPVWLSVPLDMQAVEL
jgi:acetolactate synthase-1/2/3 large subunit